MKTPDPFESFLAAQPFRPLPSEWREQILSAANALNPAPERPRGMVVPVRLRHAWAALAASWLGLALLHFDTPPAPIYAGPLPRPTAADLERQFVRRRAEAATLLALLDSKHLSHADRVPPPAAPSTPDAL